VSGGRLFKQTLFTDLRQIATCPSLPTCSQQRRFASSSISADYEDTSIQYFLSVDGT
jgi:hypothetical protein